MSARRPVRPRALAHRGVVDAAGVVVHDAPRRDGRGRVVSLWSPGTSVFRVAGGWLVRFASPRRVRAEEAPGDPLVPRAVSGGALLASAPLLDAEAAELAAAGARPGDVVRVRGGEAVVERPAAADAVDVSEWIDLGPVERLDVATLGDPPARLVAPEEAPRPLRDVLVGVTAASASAFADAFRAALEALLGGGATREGEAAAEGASPGVGARFFMALAAVSRWFAGLARRRDEGGARELARAEDVAPSRFERWIAAVNLWVAGALRRARIAELLGARYAKYLADMVELFERGDLAEALRRAIPLRGDGGGGGGGGGWFPWGLPSPRKGLDITPRGGGGGASVGVGTSVFDRIRALYRAAAERLEREGRVEEAAFVLAELLGDVAAAVALLERHGRLVRAAELAEAAKLAPELVVRQWMVAGDRARAVLHARRTQCFAVAVARLETSDPALGAALRREWALTLAASGDLPRAVEAAWPAESLRPMTDPWVSAAIALGGAGGARMLARKLALRPERFAEVLAGFEAIERDASPEGLRARAAFAEALVALPPAPGPAALARRVARSLVEEGARGRVAGARGLVAKLVERSGDGALRVDVPSWVEPARAPLAAAEAPLRYAADVADVGAHVVHDAAMLPDGSMALAMGEAGVWVLSPGGRVSARLDAPANVLVVSDHGDRCLAVASRGQRRRVTRVDLASRRAEPWGEVALDAFANTFDGETWVAAEGREVFRLDVLAPRPEVLRAVVRVDRGAAAAAIVRDRTGCAFRTSGTPGAEVWAYDLPSWTLRVRRPATSGRPALEGIDASGARLVQFRSAADAPRVLDPVERPLDLRGAALAPGDAVAACAMDARWCALALASSGDVTVALCDRATLRARWVATLAAPARCALRLTEEHLVVADDRGRVLAVDLRHGDLARDLRV